MIFHYDRDSNIEQDQEMIYEVIQLIKKENPGFCKIFDENNDDERIREEIYSYIYKFEEHCLQSNHLNAMQRHYSKQAIAVLKNIFSTRNERIAKFSILKSLKRCLKKDYNDISIGLAYELLFLFRALKGTNGLDKTITEPRANKPEWTNLDAISREVKKWISRYPSGLDDLIIQRRLSNQQQLKAKYGATDQEWNSWEWQRVNVIRDLSVLNQFIALSDEEKEAISLASKNNIPFGITPYYLSLLDLDDKEQKYDQAVRNQAVPQLQCIIHYLELRETNNNGVTTDFEHILPEISITRGYPMTAIFKPIYNSSRTLCMYGEKNWEMNYALWQKNAIQLNKIERAIGWFENHTEVNEILITGDILIYEESIIEEILSRLADIPHIQRIRISSKMPVILPLRITNSLIHLLTSYQITGRRDISLMTHFEHPYEVTLEAMRGIQKLSKAGIHVYNQSVYTIDNSRRFEMAALRKQLRLIGVDPYYSFNASKNYHEERVPIARMLQEQNEESRLAPGIDRADEAVLSIPGVGKNYLRVFQEHELIMILKDGSRLYEFYPSDVYLDKNKPFLYQDVPIYSFLNRLAARNENIAEYQSIWYYY